MLMRFCRRFFERHFDASLEMAFVCRHFALMLRHYYADAIFFYFILMPRAD